ncbi:BBE domain-containing protein [Streptomyces chrestomyceticus]|uniref:BBE domain-containing protein n=1 Tax=Streptomyces chrestomyceticus TaxID=68185 RepID=UPI0037990CF3
MGFGDNAAADLVRSAYDSEDHRRLTGLKATYDPGNIFRLNYNIPPLAGAG